MSSHVEYEAANINPPLKNGTGMANMVALGVGTSSQSVNLGTYFGKHTSGHFYTFAADGGKVYVALASNGGDSIDETVLGKTSQICWPIPDGQQLSFRIPGAALERGPTGYATGVDGYHFVHYKGSSGTQLRIYRSSLGHAQDAGEFPHPSGMQYLPGY